MSDAKQVTGLVLGHAKRAGAEEAEAFLQRNRELTVNVRNGKAESVKQADSRGLGLRVITGGKSALVYTSDFRPDALRSLAERAQVLTITHLPQIASVAAAHFRVEKVPGDPAHTRIERLSERERRDELERMLGGAEFLATIQ